MISNCRLILIFSFSIIIFFTSCSGYYKKEGKVFLRLSNEAHIGVEYKELKLADYESFNVINHDLNIDLAKDKNYVFYGDKILDYADPKTFTQIKDYYWKDKNFVFLLQFSGPDYSIIMANQNGSDYRIIGADSKTFIVLKDLWTIDKNYIYYSHKKLDSLNIAQFHPIDIDWGHDNNNYYWHDNKLETIDFSSVKILSSDYIKDKFHVYYQNKIVYECDPISFVTDGVGSFGHDNKNMFDGEKNKGPITDHYRKTYIEKR